MDATERTEAATEPTRPGDVLVYTDHPGCAVEVVEVNADGANVRARVLTNCVACATGDPDGDAVTPTSPHPRLAGVWDVPPALLRPATDAERAHL